MPAGLERICVTCLEKDAEKRYPTAGLVTAALRAWLANPEAKESAGAGASNREPVIGSGHEPDPVRSRSGWPTDRSFKDGGRTPSPSRWAARTSLSAPSGRKMLVAGAGVATLAILLLAVTLTLSRKDGRETQIAVPKGSSSIAHIDARPASDAVRAPTNTTSKGAMPSSAAPIADLFFRDKVLAATRPEGLFGGLGSEVTFSEAIDAAENKLAEAYLAAGRLNDAIPFQVRGYELSRAKLGPDHPETLKRLSNLATAYRQAGRAAEAIPLFKEVLAVNKAKLGSDHPFTLVATNNLAAAYQDAGRNADALPLQMHVFEWSRAILGPEHPDSLIAANNLAAAYIRAQRTDEAIPLLDEVVRIRRMQLDPDHPDTLVTMSNLAMACLATGQIDRAISLYGEILAARQAKLTMDHPATLNSLNALAYAYREAGRTAEAIPLFEQAVALRKAKLGPNHPDTLASINNLGGATWR